MTRDPLPLDLTLACSRFYRLAARRADVGVSSVTWRVAAAIDAHGQLRPAEIATLEQVSRPTATAVIQRLEEEGIVDRRPDPDDSRSTLVRLTDRGRAALAAWRERLGHEVAAMLGDLADDDRAALDRAITILTRALESDASSPGPASRTAPPPTTVERNPTA